MSKRFTLDLVPHYENALMKRYIKGKPAYYIVCDETFPDFHIAESKAKYLAKELGRNFYVGKVVDKVVVPQEGLK